MLYIYLPYTNENAAVIATLQAEHGDFKVVNPVAVTTGVSPVKNFQGEFIKDYTGNWELCFAGFTPENLELLASLDGAKIFDDPIDAINYKAGILT